MQDFPTVERSDAERDVDALCALVREHYVYFAPREDVWDATCESAKQEARTEAAATPAGHLKLLEHMLDQLWDNHVSLNVNSPTSPRLVPSGSDYWIDFTGGNAVVTAVRPSSGAAKAGLKVGDRVVAMNGMPVLSAASDRIRHGRNAVSEARLVWALNAQAAGYRGQMRGVTVERGGTELDLFLDEPMPEPSGELVTYQRLKGNIGYIRIDDSLGDDAAVAAFDAALEKLEGASGWVIDLRNTPGGGNTSVAEPMLGRFIRGVKPYQKAGPRWEGEAVRHVASRGPWRVKGRVAVLAGRWTGSMGEGLAIGFDGLRRARVFGSPMAALAGGVEGFELPASGWSVRLPSYNLYHMKGMERHVWHPPYAVIADNGAGPDVALQAAKDWLNR
ncbi:S41 family peptidase [Henriciella barbarensis]|uniref:S41 family peptidase n=1 Tax=Henriciella barbarensis TaxID=86342 RepID=UPI0015FC745D|nr:S41 family peptidase [Henriciella barbarensis]